ncbi:hypothetical protein ASPSYDRAFT_964562 [Aspergillus sydowii CBS 593.65]|uniref:Uncharacterized protein n=1 Tax=Aspergillus sydowii CBS 593.65 TaxID=1036612 RepID=A0A1L9TGV6_9EURO|nr:uncharacterized protein ASPSYDRAFT_964562 [Aspergillus sydowii CBS 593.65]OJJ58664.1 hypothetical protein ASPSYDRAFT_964562 [Aspergillus sydowii CBS 593.65]
MAILVTTLIIHVKYMVDICIYIYIYIYIYLMSLQIMLLDNIPIRPRRAPPPRLASPNRRPNTIPAMVRAPALAGISLTLNTYWPWARLRESLVMDCRMSWLRLSGLTGIRGRCLGG